MWMAGYPRHSGTANLTYEGKTFNILFQGQYTGKVKFNLDEAANARNISGVSDWMVFNTTVGVKVNDQFNLRFIVDNLFNASAPFPALSVTGGTRPYYSGLIGRFFRVVATARF